MTLSGNIFADVSSALGQEQFDQLCSAPGVHIERIISTGQASPLGFWYDQPWLEWVVVLAGSAGLRIEGETEIRTLIPGDFIELPARLKHRVEWTDADKPTIWLTVRINPPPWRPRATNLS